MYKKTPKEINGVVGYRTKMPKKNKDTWKFAHNLTGIYIFLLNNILN